MTLFFYLCKCTSICRLRPTLSNFIRCQIMTAATKKQSRKTLRIIHIYIHIYVHIYVHIFVHFYLKFDFQWMLGLEHFMNLYEPLKAFYCPKQKKRAFYRSLVSPASPTNGPTPVFSPICTYLRTSLLGGLPTAPPFTLLFVPFRSVREILASLLRPFAPLLPLQGFQNFLPFGYQFSQFFFGKFFH